jgi:phenylalanine-4-hydroxylase
MNAGLTTTRAPFIENARKAGKRFIHQPYELYSEENHACWRELFARIRPRWEQYANSRFLDGVRRLALDPDAIPRLEDVNRFLKPLSGFTVRAVSGYVPAYIFFDCLRTRQFPTTITIRSLDSLDYLPEPDIFHDVAGHVPMHTDRRFSDVLVRFGEVAHAAATLAGDMPSSDQQLLRMENIIKAMARFFWFTIEFGLMRENGGIKAYGSGLLSSYGELQHSLESPEVQRCPFQLDWVINQYFEIDHYQPLLFIVDSFEHLYDAIDRFEGWMREGRLNRVSPGEPAVNEDDLRSFLHLG